MERQSMFRNQFTLWVFSPKYTLWNQSKDNVHHVHTCHVYLFIAIRRKHYLFITFSHRNKKSKLHPLMVQSTTTEDTSPPKFHQTSFSSRHFVFDTQLPGRSVVDVDKIARYGRHSGDSRIRAMKKKNRNINTRSTVSWKLK